MNVTVSVGGRFHAFDLASQMEKRGHLCRLITSYPKFKAVEWGIPREGIISILSQEILNRACHRLPGPTKRIWNPQFWLHERYDRCASSNIPEDTDIFVGWSGQSLRCLREAKHSGAVTVLERGSSHVLYQRDILLEEYARFGLRAEVAHPRIVEKEIQEYAEADYVSVPSSFVRRTFIDRGVPEEKLVQVPYGVDLARFRPAERADDVFRVIHCGGISVRKGVHYLLRAFHELALKGAELWLIGNVNDEMRPMLANNANANIQLRGTFRQAELYKQYARGSVFCLASIEEGLAMVIPQAMACGLPVICTENTGGGDIVRHGLDGFVVPICDVGALKEKILFMYENRERCRTMGNSAQQRVQTGFTWDDYGEKMTAFYSSALSGSQKQLADALL